MLNQKLLLWTFCIDRGFACEWLVGVIKVTEIETMEIFIVWAYGEKYIALIRRTKV